MSDEEDEGPEEKVGTISKAPNQTTTFKNPGLLPNNMIPKHVNTMIMASGRSVGQQQAPVVSNGKFRVDYLG